MRLRDDSTMIRVSPIWLVFLVLISAASPGRETKAEGPAAPRRVVSFNICADQLAVALADPAQIVGLSPYATQPALSAVAEEARTFPQIQWHAESTISLNPDLVLVGPRDRSVTQRLLNALGFRVVEIEFVSTIAQARAQIQRVAALPRPPPRVGGR